MRPFALFVIAGSSISSAFNFRGETNSGQREMLLDRVPISGQDEGIKVSCSALRLSPSDSDVSSSLPTLLTCSMRQHHMAIKTSSIEMSIAFYSLLNFYPIAKFRSGPARAAWLEHMPNGEDSRDNNTSETPNNARIELIEIPDKMLYEGLDEEARKQMPRKRALDRMANSAVLGWDHMCLDVTESIRAMSFDGDEASCGDLQGWIDALNSKSQAKFGKDLRVALQPRVKLFGREQHELAFIYDADGALIELVNMLGSESTTESSWDDGDDSRIIWRNS